MRQRDLTAAVTANAKRTTTAPTTETRERPRDVRREEPSHNIGVRISIALDDDLEDLLLRVNRAARAEGRSLLKKRELIETALRELLKKTPGEVLDLAS